MTRRRFLWLFLAAFAVGCGFGGTSSDHVVVERVPNGGLQPQAISDAQGVVHIAYFTAWATDVGEIQYFNDVYGYETNIHMGFEGKSHLIVKRKEELGPIRAEVVGRMVETRPSPANKEWMKNVFKTF